MYKAFYSLSTAPFAKESKGDTFESVSFQEATACLTYMMQVRGMGMLVGEPGVGKTFALRMFTATLHPSRYHTVYFPLATGTVSDFYRGIAYGLSEEPRTRKGDLFRQIQGAITRSYHERKVTPVLILDEMHLANHAFLSDLHLLFNFQLDSSNPFILLLCGLPSLIDRLALNHHRPLAQRLLVRHRMEPLNKDEVSRYVDHHMRAAGAKHDVFDDSAMEALVACSQGYPRLINQLAVHALLYGCQKKKEQVNADIIRLAAEEYGLGMP